MDDKFASYAPMKFEMKVMLVGESGEYEGYTAWADIDLPPGEVPTQDAIDRRIRNAMEQQGFRLATRHEFVQELIAERMGGVGDFAIPGPNVFAFKPETDA